MEINRSWIFSLGDGPTFYGTGILSDGEPENRRGGLDKTITSLRRLSWSSGSDEEASDGYRALDISFEVHRFCLENGYSILLYFVYFGLNSGQISLPDSAVYRWTPNMCVAPLGHSSQAIPWFQKLRNLCAPVKQSLNLSMFFGCICSPFLYFMRPSHVLYLIHVLVSGI